MARHTRALHHSETEAEGESSEENQEIVDQPLTLDDVIQNRIVRVNGNTNDVHVFMEEARSDIRDILVTQLDRMRSFRSTFTLIVRFSRLDNEGQIVTNQGFFSTRPMYILNPSDIDEVFSELLDIYRDRIEGFMKEGSGWTIDEIEHLELAMFMYAPWPTSAGGKRKVSEWGPGGCYIPTPKCLTRGKKGIVNIATTKNDCFAYSILAHKYPVASFKIRNDPKHYAKFIENGVCDFSMISFPTPIGEITKWEKINKTSVNVLAYQATGIDKGLYPLRISNLADENREDHINLLLLEGENNNYHYCYISDISSLFGHRTAHNGKTHFCPKCLHFFSNEKRFNEHEGDCKYGAQRVTLPEEGKNIMEFHDIHKQLRVPYIVIFDTEAFNEKIPQTVPSTSATVNLTHHVMNSYGYQVICVDPAKNGEYKQFRGPNAAAHFLQSLLTDVMPRIQEDLENPHPIVMTDDDTNKFELSVYCHLCEKAMGPDRVRNHDHWSGKFMGPAHNACNLQWKYRRNQNTDEFLIPILSHNLKFYDAAHIISEMGRFVNEIPVIAQNMEKYISFDFRCFRFLDSFSFLPSSLSTLVENLAKDDPLFSKFPSVRSNFEMNKLPLLIRKGVYPYTFVDGADKFLLNELPPKDAFFNDLRQEAISDADYAHAQLVWDEFDCQTLGEYHDLYLKLDVLLLSDCFESFRTTCMVGYELDPCHYYTSPGLSWSALMKKTGVKLELLTDLSMHIMLEKGKRGGITQMSCRLSRANNPDTPDFDPTKPCTYIAYHDCNSLYPTSMILPLPYGGFEWVSDEDCLKMDLPFFLSIPDDAETGYFLEVDLHVPDCIHDSTAQYPFCAENMEISESMLSCYAKEVWSKFHGTRPYKGSKKLILSLLDKNNYVIHYVMLKQCINNGLQLLRVRRAIRFQQKPWMKEYIDYNAYMRQKATNEAERNFYKGMSNFIYGKSLEGVRDRQDVQLVSDVGKFLKLAAKPRCLSIKRFNENLVAVHLKRINIRLQNPIYAGIAILDLSKTIMYSHFYEYLKPKYGDKLTLLGTDTDSFIFHVECNDLYSDMKVDSHLFDFSSLPITHRAYDPSGRKVLGLFKDEMSGDIIHEFVGLRSKLYYIKTATTETKRAKGVNRCVTENQIRHETYRNCLASVTTEKHDMYRIRLKNQKLYTSKCTKITMSAFDDKRYLFQDGISSVPYGHYSLSAV